MSLENPCVADVNELHKINSTSSNRHSMINTSDSASAQSSLGGDSDANFPLGNASSFVAPVGDVLHLPSVDIDSIQRTYSDILPFPMTDTDRLIGGNASANLNDSVQLTPVSRMLPVVDDLVRHTDTDEVLVDDSSSSSLLAHLPPGDASKHVSPALVSADLGVEDECMGTHPGDEDSKVVEAGHISNATAPCDTASSIPALDSVSRDSKIEERRTPTGHSPSIPGVWARGIHFDMYDVKCE